MRERKDQPHPNLPEKNWYTLDEVQERWGCTSEYLKSLWIDGKLEVCRFERERDFGEGITRISTWGGDHGIAITTEAGQPVVTREELNRCERAYFGASHPGGQPAQDTLDPRERATLLQMIRVMDRKLNLDEKPKAAARKLQEYAAGLRFEIRGKEDTLAEKIKEARNLED